MANEDGPPYAVLAPFEKTTTTAVAHPQYPPIFDIRHRYSMWIVWIYGIWTITMSWHVRANADRPTPVARHGRSRPPRFASPSDPSRPNSDARWHGPSRWIGMALRRRKNVATCGAYELPYVGLPMASY